MTRKSKTRFAAPGLGPSDNRRPARVADMIKKEVAMLLLRKLRDPRLLDVSITGVDMSPDLKNARIYFSCGDEYIKDAGVGLASAKGFIRSSLAKILSMKYMPQLNFVHDKASIRHQEMAKLFMEIENERKESSEEDS